MLEQLQKPTTNYEERFRDNLIKMLMCFRMSQLAIASFQDSEVIKNSPEFKQLKRFTQEVYVKLQWFYTTFKKIAGPNADFLEEELSLEGDKVNNSVLLVDYVALNSKDLEKEVNFLTSPSARKRMMQQWWQQIKEGQDFEQWYNSVFPE